MLTHLCPAVRGVEKPRKILSLLTFLTALISVCVLPLAVLAIYLAVNHLQTLQAQTDEEAQRQALNVAKAIDRHIRSQIAALQVIAASPLVDDPLRFNDLHKQARAFRENFRGHIILADLSMQMIFHTREPFGATLPKLPRPKTHPAAPAVLKTGKPAVGDMFLGVIAREPLVAVAVPVVLDGETRYILLSIIECRQFQQRLDEMSIPESWSLTILDGKDEIMARRAPAAAERQPAHHVPNGRFTARSEVSHWSVVLEIPPDVYRAQFATAVAGLVAAILATTLACVLGGRLASRRLVRSVAALAEPGSLPPSSPIIADIEAVRQTLEKAAAARGAAESTLQVSERRFRQLFDVAPVPLCLFDKDGSLVNFNDRFNRTFGYEPQDIATVEDWLRLAFPDEGHRLRAAETWNDGARRARQKNADIEPAEFRITCKNGDVRTILISGKPLGDEMLTVFFDISDLKRSEESLRESEKNYRLLIENLNAGVVVHSADSRVLLCNRVAERLLGLSRDEKVGIFSVNPAWSFVREDGSPMPPEEFPVNKVASTLQPLSNLVAGIDRMDTDDRTWVLVNAYPAFNEKNLLEQVVVTFVDITDRKRAEDALAESEKIYRATFDTALVGIDLVDGDGRFLEVNNTLAQFLGYTTQELRQLTILDITHPEDAGRSREMHQAIVQDRLHQYRIEKRYVRKDGATLWADTAVSAIRDADGKHQATVGVINDISERKKLEEARQRLAAAVEQAAEIVEITDRQGIIVYVNPSFERTTGYSREEALGRNPSILKSGQHDAEFYRELWGTISAGKIWTGHLINKKKDGTLYEENVSISPVKDDSGNIVNYVAVKRDITVEASLQRQLLQAQKMEAVGALAGGVAHDFNNILQVALGYSELVLGDEHLSETFKADIEKINEAAKRGADLVQRLMTFSRKTEALQFPLDLNERIRQLHGMLERTIQKMIEIQLKPANDLQAINADATQLDQVLMNLAVNARDAMPYGGRLVFETANILLDEEYAKSHLNASPGHYVLLSVTDTGTGMDQETLDHIFEPFYTTKETGKGTGLGLAMVYAIVQHHGGHIRCYSEPGSGTTFKIYFPALISDDSQMATTQAAQPSGGSETILLVDDEELVRDLGTRVLTKAGYKVLTAANGKDALEVYEKHRDEVSLVILDFIMPEMAGDKCIEALLRMDPSAKVIIASGYSAEGSTRDALSAGARAFVNKPYNIRQLLQKARQVLDER